MLAGNGARCPYPIWQPATALPETVDSYPPNWLADHNKVVFGVLFVVGELIVVGYWLREKLVFHRREMSKLLWKARKITLLSVVGLLLTVLGAVLGYRAYLQRVNAQAIAIHTPNGIDEGMYVKIGGIDQWIQVPGAGRM